MKGFVHTNKDWFAGVKGGRKVLQQSSLQLQVTPTTHILESVASYAQKHQIISYLIDIGQTKYISCTPKYFRFDFIFYYCVHSSLSGLILMLMEIVHLCVKLGKLLGILKVIKACLHI